MLKNYDARYFKLVSVSFSDDVDSTTITSDESTLSYDITVDFSFKGGKKYTILLNSVTRTGEVIGETNALCEFVNPTLPIIYQDNTSLDSEYSKLTVDDDQETNTLPGGIVLENRYKIKSGKYLVKKISDTTANVILSDTEFSTFDLPKADILALLTKSFNYGNFTVNPFDKTNTTLNDYLLEKVNTNSKIETLNRSIKYDFNDHLDVLPNVEDDVNVPASKLKDDITEFLTYRQQNTSKSDMSQKMNAIRNGTFIPYEIPHTESLYKFLEYVSWSNARPYYDPYQRSIYHPDRCLSSYGIDTGLNFGPYIVNQLTGEVFSTEIEDVVDFYTCFASELEFTFSDEADIDYEFAFTGMIDAELNEEFKIRCILDNSMSQINSYYFGKTVKFCNKVFTVVNNTTRLDGNCIITLTMDDKMIFTDGAFTTTYVPDSSDLNEVVFRHLFDIWGITTDNILCKVNDPYFKDTGDSDPRSITNLLIKEGYKTSVCDTQPQSLVTSRELTSPTCYTHHGRSAAKGLSTNTYIEDLMHTGKILGGLNSRVGVVGLNGKTRIQNYDKIVEVNDKIVIYDQYIKGTVDVSLKVNTDTTDSDVPDVVITIDMQNCSMKVFYLTSDLNLIEIEETKQTITDKVIDFSKLNLFSYFINDMIEVVGDSSSDTVYSINTGTVLHFTANNETCKVDNGDETVTITLPNYVDGKHYLITINSSSKDVSIYEAPEDKELLLSNIGIYDDITGECTKVSDTDLFVVKTTNRFKVNGFGSLVPFNGTEKYIRVPMPVKELTIEAGSLLWILQIHNQLIIIAGTVGINKNIGTTPRLGSLMMEVNPGEVLLDDDNAYITDTKVGLGEVVTEKSSNVITTYSKSSNIIGLPIHGANYESGKIYVEGSKSEYNKFFNPSSIIINNATTESKHFLSDTKVRANLLSATLDEECLTVSGKIEVDSTEDNRPVINGYVIEPYPFDLPDDLKDITSRVIKDELIIDNLQSDKLPRLRSKFNNKSQIQYHQTLRDNDTIERSDSGTEDIDIYTLLPTGYTSFRLNLYSTDNDGNQTHWSNNVSVSDGILKGGYYTVHTTASDGDDVTATFYGTLESSVYIGDVPFSEYLYDESADKFIDENGVAVDGSDIQDADDPFVIIRFTSVSGTLDVDNSISAAGVNLSVNSIADSGTVSTDDTVCIFQVTSGDFYYAGTLTRNVRNVYPFIYNGVETNLPIITRTDGLNKVKSIEPYSLFMRGGKKYTLVDYGNRTYGFCKISTGDSTTLIPFDKRTSRLIRRSNKGLPNFSKDITEANAINLPDNKLVDYSLRTFLSHHGMLVATYTQPGEIWLLYINNSPDAFLLKVDLDNVATSAYRVYDLDYSGLVNPSNVNRLVKYVGNSFLILTFDPRNPQPKVTTFRYLQIINT